jgi:hypothetical protein
MSRSVRIADVIGAVAGIAAAVLIFFGVASVDPQLGVTDQELQTWWADSGNRDGFIFSMYMLLVACPLFLLFVSRLRLRLRAADTAGWADTAFGFGIVMTAAMGMTSLLRGIIPAAMRFGDEPLPGVDTLRFATSLAYASWDVVILFAGVLVAIVSILALVTRALPRWLGVLGLIVCIGCAGTLAVQSAAFSLPLVNIWVVASCVHLLRTPAEVAIVESARTPEIASVRA